MPHVGHARPMESLSECCASDVQGIIDSIFPSCMLLSGLFVAAALLEQALFHRAYHLQACQVRLV